MKQATDSAFSFGWVDLVIILLLLVGVWRGRKRGMSEELLDIIKWSLIVVAAAWLYEPGGRLLSQVSVFSLLSCYVFVYAGIALIVAGLFAVIRRGVGSKIVGSDVFGNGEYYLGMMAGTFRYACIILVSMAFLNARHYTPEERTASTKYQQDNFGSSFFITMPDLQQEVFAHSFTGRMAHHYLNVALIRSTTPDGKGLGKDTDIGRRRENSVYEILDPKR
jgi:uncharacterized membrane protein required for colicin V production